MQLIVVLGVLVAINFGIVYVGSEAGKEEEPAQQGVVEVEPVADCAPDTDCSKPEEVPAKQ
ncbi:MAG: hypothetical protein HPY82_26300 [Gammaproteobacteria bacterium]|nr:hypothetical protein [Gammaproteobacteria bacterium]